MQRLVERSAQVTGVLLLASVGLIAPGLVGLGASLPLATFLLVPTVLLFAGREEFDAIGQVGGLPLGLVLRVAWVGPLLSAGIVVYAGGASPGEIQAYGGICGLLGMANYFLRPVYGLLFAAGRYLARSLEGGRQL